VAAFLAAQVLLPLTWYLGDDADYDARFAWRMFARQAAVRCTPEARGAAPIDLAARFAEPWLHRLRDGWAGVLDQVAAHLCREDASVVVTLTCVEPDGRTRTLERTCAR
jgi:hypothetical protein